jgi:hypothetical protein
MPQTRFETEVFRMVVAGSCDIDGQIYEYGDIRIQRPGAACGPVVAGPNGLQEVLILGDRRHAVPTVENNEMWPATLGAIVDDLQGVLSAQSST